jgi:hypothetical protein
VTYVKIHLSQSSRSDIPIEVVRAVVMPQGSAAINGFAIDEQGSVVRTGVAETDSESTTEVITAELAVELGRGRRAKTGSKKYGAEREGHQNQLGSVKAIACEDKKEPDFASARIWAKITKINLFCD